jgi:drug/metabolite transporter (DMT)-like permease
VTDSRRAAPGAQIARIDGTAGYPSGAGIVAVTPGGPADRAGLRAGDVISSAGPRPGTVIAVLSALAAAGSFGVAAALQHSQARETAAGKTLRFRLLTDLASRPAWRAGIVLAAAAYGLQALALAFGPLALVAPIVATDLLFAMPLAAWWSRRPMRRRDWAGCALVASGIGIFLATSPPSSGRSDASAWEWVLAFGAVTLVCAVAVTLGNIRRAALRAGLLAAAAGVTFGLTAAVTLSASRLFRDAGPASILGHWQPWALITLGLAGLLLSQSAYQAGQLPASLPVIDTVEPISGVVIGTAVFDERLATYPAVLAIQLSGAVIAVAGIAMLAPHIKQSQSAHETSD